MKKICLLLLVTLFIGCSNSDETTSETITPFEIYDGSLYGNGSEGITESRLVISNATTWNSLLTSIDSANDVTSQFAETTIDFENYDIIALFDQVRGNGGHSIEATSIVENDQTILVSVNLTSPSGNATTVMTQPFHIYKVPKINKPVVFE